MAQARARWIAALVLVAGSAPRLDGQSVLRLGLEFQVSTYTASNQQMPAIDLDADGDFVVAWQSSGQDGAGEGVFARRFNAAGIAQAAEFLVNSHTMAGQQRPAVGLGPTGAFVVAWDSYNQDESGGSGAFARIFNAAGVPQAAEFQVNSYTPSYQGRPQVALTSGGDFVVAWQSFLQDGNSNGVFARRFDATGVGQAAEFQVSTYTISVQADPAIGIDGDGDFVVAWTSFGQDGYNYGIFARRFNSAGAPQAIEFMINGYTSNAQLTPAVAVSGDGSFLVAWSDSARDGDQFGVFARAFDAAGAPRTAQFQVNLHTIGDQLEPAASVDANGRFVVAWHSATQDGDGYGVFARRFAGDGTPLSGEFQINTYTPTGQINPAIASDGGGRFVVAWTSDNGQDGSAYGVFAQRLAPLAVLDIDGNGEVAPLSDGLLVVRYLFGFTGTTLTNGAVDLGGCSRCNAAAIEPYLQGLV